ncbi:MAG: ABC transporter ATP-binding protein [Desulfurococcaceae archaeon]
MNIEVPVLDARNIYFKYPRGGPVLRGVNLTVLRREHVLIVGDTGSGKTTLTRILTKMGTLIYEGELSGTIRILGRRIEDIDINELTRLVHVIGQNPYSYFTEPLVREDLLNYALRVHGSQERAERAVKKVIEATGVHELLDRYFYELSGGEARRVLVAKTLVSDPILLLFDEPLMWLDDSGVNEFLDLLGLLRRLGKSVIIFEHRFLPVIRGVDRVYLLERGVLRDVTELALKLIKMRLNPVSELAVKRTSTGRTVLELQRVCYSYGSNPVLRGVNLEVREADSVLIYGLNGSGKTTLLKVIAGYLKPREGTVKRYYEVMYIPQNIILFYTEETVEKELREICKARKRGEACISEGKERIKALGVDLQQSPFNLSHGQMVKLSVVLAQTAGAKILLIDEPFSGLTYSDRVKLLEYLKDSVNTFIVTTSTLDAYQRGVWTKTYKLENGLLAELSGSSKYPLQYAAQFYEALKHGISY